jgi:cytochrome P450
MGWDVRWLIYGHSHQSPWYYAWMPPDPSKANLFTDLNPVRHGLQRRKFAASYSMSSLVGYESFVNNCASLLTQRFSEIAASGKSVDFQHWLQCYAFDVIGEITFASRFGFLDMGVDEGGVFGAIDKRGEYGTFVGIFPWVHRWIFPMLPKTGGYGYVLNYTSNQIEGRQKTLKDPLMTGREGPPDIMTKILTAHEADPEKVTRADLLTMCQSNISAGSDTTAITLSAIFYHLLKYPKTWGRLQKEIDQAAEEGRISNPVTFREAQELPYLQAVIKEALRIHPATGLPLLRVVPAEGAMIAGRFIPGGVTVGINAWVAHRNKVVYGEDADMWRPERWLEIEAEGRGAEVEKYFFGESSSFLWLRGCVWLIWIAFGMGSRTCIGKNISLLEMSTLVPQLARKFDLALDDDLERDGLVSLNRWFVKQQNFHGKVYLRRPGEKA